MYKMFTVSEQGKEFLIDCISPPSAPARGPSRANPMSNLVLIVVTNHTLFPAGERTFLSRNQFTKIRASAITKV